MRRVPHAPGSLSEEGRASLERDGVLYVEHVTHDEELLALAAQLGEITAQDGGLIYSVKVRSAGRGELDEHGHVTVSSTNQAFSLHTDGYNHAEPPRYVLLLRTDDAPDDTLSYVSDSREALRALGAEVVAVLSRPVFPSALGPMPLVERHTGGTLRLRFNGDKIDRWAEDPDPNQPMDDRAREAVAELGRGLRDCQQTLTIGPADCLILDNWRVCHGRSGMTADSRRVLKRVWVS